MHSNRQIILHVGSPKCGSTYLQQVMLRNQDTLLAHGIHYPHDNAEGAHPGNAADLGDLTKDQLLGWFGDGVHTVVLSHEDMFSWALRGRTLATLTAAENIKVQVVVFLRPFSAFVFGDYSQFMKQKFETWLENRNPYDGKDFEAFSTRRIDTLIPATFLQNWSRLFSKTPLILAGHKEIRPVLSTLLGPGPVLDWTIPHTLANRSLRVEDCEKIALAMRDPGTSEDTIRAMHHDAFRLIGHPDAGRSQARIAQIEALFEPQNQALVEQFGFDNRLPGAKN